MKGVKLNLTTIEKLALKKAGLKQADINKYAADELCSILDINEQRARQIYALIEFQSIPSIGPKFAHDLIEMGYYSVADLRGKCGAQLLNQHECLIGTTTDPCVEDQFRLIVDYANTPASSKQWWDFTAERKAFRKLHGYPNTRPSA